MADAPGVTQENRGWGFILTGSKADLIAGEVCKADWFVNDKERDKWGRIKRTKRFTSQGRKIRTIVPAKGQCTVWVYNSQEELEEQQKPKPLSPNAQRLVDLGGRVTAIAGLVTAASHDIHAKLGKSKTLRDSSKLGRAMDDLDIAKNGISEVLKTLQALIDFGGDDEDDGDDDGWEDDDDNDRPVLPIGPLPSIVTT